MFIITDYERPYNGKTLSEHYLSLGFLDEPKDIPVEYGYQLEDVTTKGKVKPWNVHKSSTLLLSESFDRLGKFKKAENVLHCGRLLKFMACPHGHYKRLKWASFCRIRLCPMCGWRRSLKVASQVKKIAHIANENFQLRWIFLTLTCRNVSAENLPDQLDLLTKSFKRLFEKKIFKNNVLGFFKGLEVTKNHETNTYHPHVHVLLAVRPQYFGKGYIKQSEWTNLWQDAMRSDYKPVVDIRVVKGKRNLEEETRILESKGIVEDEPLQIDIDDGIIAEMSKYTVKAADYIIPNDNHSTDETVATLEANLNHRRLFAFGGILKDIYEFEKKQKTMQDVESSDADLIYVEDDTGCKCSVCESDLLEELYRWVPHVNKYLGAK